VADDPVTAVLPATQAFTGITLLVVTPAAVLTVNLTYRHFTPNITTVKAAVSHTQAATSATTVATSPMPIVYPSPTIMVITYTWGAASTIGLFATWTVLRATTATATAAITV
jgi:hypothetical protein